MRTITKDHYLEVLLSQLAHFHSKENVNPEDLETLVTAYEDAKQKDFEKVEVIQNGEVFKFRPILEKEHD